MSQSTPASCLITAKFPPFEISQRKRPEQTGPCVPRSGTRPPAAEISDHRRHVKAPCIASYSGFPFSEAAEFVSVFQTKAR